MQDIIFFRQAALNHLTDLERYILVSREIPDWVYAEIRQAIEDVCEMIKRVESTSLDPLHEAMRSLRRLCAARAELYIPLKYAPEITRMLWNAEEAAGLPEAHLNSAGRHVWRVEEYSLVAGNHHSQWAYTDAALNRSMTAHRWDGRA